MLTSSKLRLSALKLSQLKESDQRWILNQLPKTVAANLNKELTALNQFGLDNPTSLIKQIEQSEMFNVLKHDKETLYGLVQGLSIAEIFLFHQGLSLTERKAFNDCLNKQQRLELANFSKTHTNKTSKKFNALFSELIVSEMDV